MTTRELFTGILAGELKNSVCPMEYMAYWPETLEEWGKQGMDTKQNPLEYFGLGHKIEMPINFQPYPAFEQKVLEEDETSLTMIDETGVTLHKYKNSSAMPHYIDFPIKDRKSYEEFATRLVGSDPARYPENWQALVNQFKNGSIPVGFLSRGPFAFYRDFMNFEDMMLMFYDDPDLMAEMAMNHADFLVELWGPGLKDLVPDFVYLGEDMAYKGSPMVSADMYRQFLMPSYQKIISFLKDAGVKIIILDSDGFIEPLLPLAMEAGFTATLPLERAAGMDPLRIQQDYPGLGLIGGVDKLEIAKGKQAIDQEIQRIAQLIRKGRYIPSFDHSVPPVVSLENYSYYIEQLHKLAKKS